MDQGLGLLSLNGLEWFEIGNNQPMTFASSHFRVTLEVIPTGGFRKHHRSRKSPILDHGRLQWAGHGPQECY